MLIRLKEKGNRFTLRMRFERNTFQTEMPFNAGALFIIYQLGVTGF